jgi:hypothetical protein
MEGRNGQNQRWRNKEKVTPRIQGRSRLYCLNILTGAERRLSRDKASRVQSFIFQWVCSVLIGGEAIET